MTMETPTGGRWPGIDYQTVEVSEDEEAEYLGATVDDVMDFAGLALRVLVVLAAVAAAWAWAQ